MVWRTSDFFERAASSPRARGRAVAGSRADFAQVRLRSRRRATTNVVMTALSVAAELRRALVPVEVRVRCLRGLLRLLQQCPVERARLIERALIERSATDEAEYLSHTRRVLFNLACNALLHDVEPSRLVHMSDSELARGTLVQRIQLEEAERIAAFSELLREKYDNVLRAKKSDLMYCKKCGSDEVSFAQVQVRGADESSSIFCTCLNPRCKKKWRIG